MKINFKCAVFAAVLLAASAVFAEEMWPDRGWLLRSVEEGVPGTLAQYDEKTGEFGTKPWLCLDQNVLFQLAVAWGTPGNRYYHDAKLLAAIAKGGERLVDDQDAKGMWVFRKKDNSTWGMIHMPWTYTSWIRAYLIVKDALPEASRAKWEKGLKLGYGHIVKYLGGKSTHNITTYHAAGVYCAGIAFGREDWKAAVRNYMKRLYARQAPDGFWSEHYGPVVGYNWVYLEALGIYYHYSHDPGALEALRRGAIFHRALLWQDGSSVSVIDERNPYRHDRRPGNVGLSHTPEGRRYLVNHFARAVRLNLTIGPQLAAMLLHEGGSGPAAPAIGDRAEYLSRDRKFAVDRVKPFQWCFSAYTCKPAPARWIMERQCHFELEAAPFGVVAGGGNSRMQPYFSTFTFGDPASHQPDYSTADPDFTCKAPVRYLADSAEIDGNTLKLAYGPNRASVTVRPDGRRFHVTYRLENMPDAAAMAHLPIMLTSGFTDADGRPLVEGVLTGRALGGQLRHESGLVIHIPEDAEVRTAVVGFNPYQTYGKGADPRMVISLPFARTDRQEVVFELLKTDSPLDGADEYPAAEIPYRGTGATVKVLDEFDAVFIRATAPGPELEFTLDVPKAGRRTLFLSAPVSNCYGIVQVLVNGKKVGEPFSTYNISTLIRRGRRVGEADFRAGKNTVTLRIVGKEPKSANFFTSVKAFHLK